MRTFDYGRCSVQVELNQKNKDGLNKYDVVVTDNATDKFYMIACGVHSISEQHVIDGFWFQEAVKFAKRISILLGAQEMCQHNIRCYKGKVEWLNEYGDELDRLETITQWIDEMVK